MSKASEIASQLIDLLKEQNQYNLLLEIVEQLQKEVFRNQDISVILAVELPELELKNLKTTLLEKWGDHRINISIDPTLLSGFIIKFQDKIIDTSGRNSLQSLKATLS